MAPYACYIAALQSDIKAKRCFVGDENRSIYFKASQSQNPPCSCEKKVIRKGDFNKTDLCNEGQFIPIGKID